MINFGNDQFWFCMKNYLQCCSSVYLQFCSDFTGTDFSKDELKTQDTVKNEFGKAHEFPFLLNVEELSDEEFEKMVEVRYRPGSSFLTYAEDKHESGGLMEGNAVVPSSEDPTIWKVKCTVLFSIILVVMFILVLISSLPHLFFVSS